MGTVQFNTLTTDMFKSDLARFGFYDVYELKYFNISHFSLCMVKHQIPINFQD